MKCALSAMPAGILRARPGRQVAGDPPCSAPSGAQALGYALLLAASLLLAGPAIAAPAGGAGDGRAELGACLAGKDARACIGKVAQTCVAAPGADTTMGMMECAGRERALWDERLNAAFASLRARATPTQASALRKAQRAWMTYRDARCAFEASRYEGGSLSGVIAGDCLLQVTADRAIELTQQAETWDQP